MINAFKKSRAARLLAAAAALVVIILVWVNDLGKHTQLYIPILATVLTAGIGYFMGRLLGNLISSSENTKLLGILHVDLDPEAFIQAYQSIPGKIRKGSRNHAVASAYLSDGYLAGGDPEKALEILEEGFKDVKMEGDLPLKGLYYSNRMVCFLEKDDYEEAKKEGKEIENVILRSEGSNQALANNLRSALLLRNTRISIHEGTAIDPEWLENMVSGASYSIRRLEIYRTIVGNALLMKDKRKAGEYLQKLVSEGGKTFYADYAEKVLSSENYKQMK